MNERSIFWAALECKTPQALSAYLDEACGGNQELRGRVESLIQAHVAGSGPVDALAGGDDPRDSSWGAGPAPLKRNQMEEKLDLSFLDPSSQTGSIGTLGNYEILEVIGHGGMGVVLKAQDTRLQRIVAIKVLSPKIAANVAAKRRFEREAQAAAAVSHDHIVTIHAVQEHHDLPYIVMECVVGRSLQTKIEETGPLELKEILRIGSQIALGLAAAHKQGLVHRDIKPSNILLQNGIQRVKIVDFGLARAADDISITQPGQIAGTPLYMSPEQAEGKTVDHRSDLFSLGSVLYTMCAGRPAFRADSTVAVLRRVCDDTPRPIREINPELPDWLGQIVGKLLFKAKQDRYQTAAELADQLSLHLARLQEPRSDSHLDPTIAQQAHPLASQSGGLAPVSSRRRARWAGMGVALGLVLGMIPLAWWWGLFAVRDPSPEGMFHPEALAPPSSERPLAAADNDPREIVPSDDAPPDSPLSENQDWPGWPADAPAPAISPFTREQAQRYQEEWAAYLQVPVEWENSIGMKFRLIPPGEFLMGLSEADVASVVANKRNENEWEAQYPGAMPRHRVRVSQPYYLGTFEVAQGQFNQVAGVNPSFYSAAGEGKQQVAKEDTSTFPVDSVSFIKAAEFCGKLSQLEGRERAYFTGGATVTVLSGGGYRIPTEAEWEFACRAGTTSGWSAAELESQLPKAAWFAANSAGQTHPAGQLQANPFGLYDMHGNVSEWCQDVYNGRTYLNRQSGITTDPVGPDVGNQRVLRGGSWYSHSGLSLAAFRLVRDSTIHHPDCGFRVAISAQEVQQSPISVAPRVGLNPQSIPEHERLPWHPSELLGVIGAQQRAHWGSVSSVALSPDSKQFLSCGADGCWLETDASQPAECITFAENPPSFALYHEALGFLSVHRDGQVLRWFTEQPSRHETLWRVPANTRVLRMSGDAKTLAAWVLPETGGQTSFEGVGDTVVMDLADNVPRERFRVRGTRRPAMTPQRDMLFVYDEAAKELQVFDLREPEVVPASRIKPSAPIWQMECKAEDQLVTLNTNNILELWSVEAHALTLLDSTDPAFSFAGCLEIAVSGDGRRVAAPHKAGARVVDIVDRRFVPYLKGNLDAHYFLSNYERAALSQDGSTLLIGPSAAPVRRWTLEASQAKEAEFQGYTVGTPNLVTSGDGSRVASHNNWGSIRIWGLDQSQPDYRKNPEWNHAGVLAFSDDGLAACVSAGHPELSLFRDSGGTWVTARLLDQNGQAASFSGQGQLAVAAATGEIILYDVTSRQPDEIARSPSLGSEIAFRQIAFQRPEGRLVAITSPPQAARELVLRVFEIDGTTIREAYSKKMSDVTAVLGRFGTHAAVSYRDGLVEIFKVGPASLTKAKEIRLGANPVAVDLSPTGSHLLAVGPPSEVGVFRCEDALRTTHWEFPGAVWNAAFLGDSGCIVTANSNRTALVLRYEMGESGVHGNAQLRKPPTAVPAVTPSP
ncbi:MAG: SUMF1/EgtB/PvdO family nonheme iron enzyme [Pirellulales bacterium]